MTGLSLVCKQFEAEMCILSLKLKAISQNLIIYVHRVTSKIGPFYADGHVQNFWGPDFKAKRAVFKEFESDHKCSKVVERSRQGN